MFNAKRISINIFRAEATYQGLCSPVKKILSSELTFLYVHINTGKSNKSMRKSKHLVMWISSNVILGCLQ